MIYNLFNLVTIIVGGLLGLLIKKGMPEKVANTVMKSLGLCVIYIGVTSFIKGENFLVIVISCVVGAYIGEMIDFDRLINRFGDYLQVKMKKMKMNDFAEGFISTSILFSTGAMGILACLQVAISNNGDTFIAKAILDGVSAIIFAASLGIGVVFSSVTTFLFQSVIILGATVLAPYLSDPVIASMSGVGGIIIVGIGLSLIIDTDIKIANLAPAVFIPIILALFGIK